MDFVAISISGAAYGVLISGSPVSVINAGFIGSYRATQVQSGGCVTNATSGTITGHYGAVLVSGGPASIVNAGTILGVPYCAVRFEAGGSLTNLAGCCVQSDFFDGVKAFNIGITLTNYGAVGGAAAFFAGDASGNTIENVGVFAARGFGGSGTDTPIVDAGSTFSGQIRRSSASNYLDVRFQCFAPGTMIEAKISAMPTMSCEFFDPMNRAYGGFVSQTPGAQTLTAIDGSGGAIETLGISFYNTNVGNLTYELDCYLRGTCILTPNGEILIEALQAGDLVATRFNGFVPIKRVGTQCFDGRRLPAYRAPVRFRAHALAPNIPAVDLFVSPAHAMLIGDYLITASLLVNDLTITQEIVTGDIAYYHLDLGLHDCVLANGAWAESYLENDNRSDYHNANCFVGLQRNDVPVAACLPIVNRDDDPRLPALRATVTPWWADEDLTTDADLHIYANGRRFEVEQIGASVWRCMLPAGVGAVRLRARSVRPSMVGDTPDHRRLAFCLFAMDVACGPDMRDIPIGHPDLSIGFYEMECEAGQSWRWTDGDALIPPSLLPSDGDPIVLTIGGRCQQRVVVGTRIAAIEA